jgi:hypothetical protein
VASIKCAAVTIGDSQEFKGCAVVVFSGRCPMALTTASADNALVILCCSAGSQKSTQSTPASGSSGRCR